MIGEELWDCEVDGCDEKKGVIVIQISDMLSQPHRISGNSLRCLYSVMGHPWCDSFFVSSIFGRCVMCAYSNEMKMFDDLIISSPRFTLL